MFTFPTRNPVAIQFILFLLLPGFVFSQAPMLTLSALTDSADHYLPRLLQKKALLNSASANVSDVKHQFLPFFRVSDEVNLATDNSLPGSYYSYGIVPSTSAGIHPENDYQVASGNIVILYSEYDLIDFGYKNARISQAKSQEAFQGADLQREIYLLNGRVSRVYFKLLKSRTRLDVARETVKRYDTIFVTIRALTLSGIKPGSDSSLAKAELSRNRIVYNQIDQQVNNDEEELSYLTGIDRNLLSVDSSLLTEINRKRVLANQPATAPNPLINYYEILKNSYLANEKLISRSYLPKIKLTAATWARGSSIAYDNQYKPLGDGIGYQRFNYLAGVSFQYDLFNGIHKKDRLKSYGFIREASELELQQQVLNLVSASKQAQNDLNISERNLLELPIQYRSAVDTYNQKIAQYKAGIISIIDLTNAAFVLDRSMNDYVETIGNWYIAQLDKAIAEGNLFQFIQSIQ